MGDGASASGRAPERLIVAGLGPGDLARLPAAHRDVLEDPARTVVVRTLHHPAAEQLARLRPVESCDDLYQEIDSFAGVYDAIADRVMTRTADGPVVYAVPGSPLIGEFAVRSILERSPDTVLLPAESFVDAVLRVVGCDPLRRGLRIVDGHNLPDPWALDAPTVVGHLDTPLVVADVLSALSRVTPEGAPVTVCVDLGSAGERVETFPVDDVPADLAGFRTSLFVDVEPAGLLGAVEVGRRLRQECPWDRKQTHDSLVRHLLEETAELVEALAALPGEDEEVDWVAYAGVEDELGDVLLQVLFHATIAQERGAFSIDDVGSRLREKLVRRHPHVFGDVDVAGADEVAANWERIKAEERGSLRHGSLMDGSPAGMASLERAARLQERAATVGFDWPDVAGIVGALAGEVDELRAALEGEGDVAHEIGDVLFSAVNLARRMGLSPDLVMRRATARFDSRFRAMEAMGSLEDVDLGQMEERWQDAKRGSDGP